MGIKIEHITKAYGNQKALNNLSFEVGNGELLGFLGPNGAGKSTMMKIITGYLTPDSGDVYINDEILSSNKTELRAQIGYLPENNPLYTDLFVKEYLEITAGFYKLKNKKARVAEMVELTGLGNEQHKKIKALSKGYRQRVGLAQSLIHNPSILILDEPTTGLDPNQLEEIRNLIKSISQEKTVLFSTHIMQEVEAICERALIINKGVLVADEKIKDLKSGKFKQSQMVYAEFSQKPDFAVLNSAKWIKNIEIVNDKTMIFESNIHEDIRPLLFKFATETQNILLTLQEQKHSIEHVFKELTL